MKAMLSSLWNTLSHRAGAAKTKAPASETANDNLPALVAGNIAFATDLYQRLSREQTGNVFFSPSSIEAALAMTYAGARSDTAKQFAETMHFALPAGPLSLAFAHLLTKLNTPAKERIFGDDGTEQERPAYGLVVANALWGQKGYSFNPEFTRLLQECYEAGLNPVDFRHAEEARTSINQWVAKQTKDKIKELLAPGRLNPETRLILTNAVYFKSNWQSTFDKSATTDGPFQLTANHTVQVPLMHETGSFGYTEDDNLQMLEMPYASHELSMLVFLPKRINDLGVTEKSLTASNLARWLKEMKPVDVEVTFPKFVFSSSFSLGDALTRMGMTLAFDPEKADFSGISQMERLFISAVIHKAFVAVDEEGTEASAATALMLLGGLMHTPESPKVFNADHPFVFLIRHNPTGEILFWGRLANPTET